MNQRCNVGAGGALSTQRPDRGISRRRPCRRWGRIGPLLSAVLVALALGLVLSARAAGGTPETVCKLQGPAQSPAAANHATLKVSVRDLSSSAGVVRFAIYASADTFTVDGGWTCKGAISATTALPPTLTFDLVPGWYAIAVAHDENNNDEIDRIIVPTEAYGFSNYAKVPFGRPDFETAKFELKPGTQTIMIPVSLHPTLRMVTDVKPKTED